MTPEKPTIAVFADDHLLGEISARLSEHYQFQSYDNSLQGDRLIARLVDDSG